MKTLGVVLGAALTAHLAYNDLPSAFAGDASCRLNQELRSIYAKSKTSDLQAEGKILIVCMADKMMLYVDGAKIAEASTVPEIYTELKNIDHIALGLHSLARVMQQSPALIDHNQIQRLQEALTDSSLMSDIDASKLSPQQKERQKKIVDRSLTFIRHLIVCESNKLPLNAQQLITYCRTIKPLLMANAFDAVAAQLDLQNDILTGWKNRTDTRRLKGVMVVIASGHMPRERNASMQMFEKMLGESREGGRLIYGEGLADEQAALDLVATHITDRHIARDFFADDWRMHRDLLSDAACAYLSKKRDLIDLKD